MVAAVGAKTVRQLSDNQMAAVFEGTHSCFLPQCQTIGAGSRLPTVGRVHERLPGSLSDRWSDTKGVRHPDRRMPDREVSDGGGGVRSAAEAMHPSSVVPPGLESPCTAATACHVHTTTLLGTSQIRFYNNTTDNIRKDRAIHSHRPHITSAYC